MARASIPCWSRIQVRVTTTTGASGQGCATYWDGEFVVPKQTRFNKIVMFREGGIRVAVYTGSGQSQEKDLIPA